MEVQSTTRALKGILLAGGRGTRLYPSTIAVSKQLLPVYDKPLIYYPLTTLLLAGARDILLITTREDLPAYRKLLGDGSQIGISLSYETQDTPRGLADAFLVGEEFLAGDPSCLVLGDNVFYGQHFSGLLATARERAEGGAAIFAYPVMDPTEFGVVDFSEDGRVLSIEEKPAHPRTNYAVPGLYFFDGTASSRARTLTASPRGELEITDLLESYRGEGKLHCAKMGRGMAWLDTGSPEGMAKASSFVRTLQETQGFYISAIEEVAYRLGYIDRAQLHALAQPLLPTAYGKYLLSI